MITDSPVGTMILFALGLYLLVSLAGEYDRTRRLYQSAERAWQEIDGLLERRSAQLTLLQQAGKTVPVLQQELSKVAEASRARNLAIDRAERLVAEQSLSRSLLRLHAQYEASRWTAAQTPANLLDLLQEMQEQEPFLLAARERYNEAASAWNEYRRTAFPALIASAFGFESLPLFRTLQ